MANNRFLSTVNIQPTYVSDSTAAAGVGDWVSLENYASCIFACVAEDGAAADDIVWQVQQSTDNAGTGAKGVAGVVFYGKNHATALDVAGAYTRSAADTYATEGTDESAILVEVGADMLDVANGFKFVALQHDAGGAATKLITGVAILCGPRYSTEASEWPAVNA